MKKNISFFTIILILATFTCKIHADTIDLGSVYVTDSKVQSHETYLLPQNFSTIINVADDGLVQNQTVADILSHSTQVFIKDTGGDSSISTVSIRGSSSKNVLIMLDDIPLNGSGNSSFNLNLIPASIIDTIEVTRGGASGMFGSSAMGGVINIRTKKADSDQLRFFSSTKNLRSANFGSELSFKDKLVGVLIALNTKIDLGNYLYKDNNGTEFNKNDDFITRMSNNKNEKTDLMVKNIFYINKATVGYNVNFTNKYNEVAGPRTFKAQYENARLKTNLLNAGVFADLADTSKFVTAKVNLNYKFDGYTYKNESRLSAKQLDCQNIHTLDFNDSVSVLCVPYNFFYFANAVKFDTIGDRRNSVLVSTTIKDEITPLDCLTITPVTRLDYYSDLDEPVNFVWNLGLSYIPTPQMKLKANVFKAFRKPDFTEMYYNQGLYIGNPDLKPETSYGGDIGFVFDSRMFFCEVVTFCTYYEKLISYVLSSGFVYRPINLDKVLSFGLECSTDIRIVKFFNIELSYTLNFVNSVADLSEGRFIQQKGHPLNRFWTKLNFEIFDYQFGVQFKFEDEITITSTGKTIACKGLLDAYFKVDFPIKTFGITPSIYINANNLLNLYCYDERNYPLEGFNLELGFILTSKKY